MPLQKIQSDEFLDRAYHFYFNNAIVFRFDNKYFSTTLVENILCDYFPGTLDFLSVSFFVIFYIVILCFLYVSLLLFFRIDSITDFINIIVYCVIFVNRICKLQHVGPVSYTHLCDTHSRVSQALAVVLFVEVPIIFFR